MDTPAGVLIWYWASSITLALLLFSPVSKFIWVIRMRRFLAREKREAKQDETEALRKKSRFIAGLISLVFAFLFTRVLLTPYFQQFP